MGSVDQVTRASPYYMELGAQVNIWVVGKGFAPGAQITFSNLGFSQRGMLEINHCRLMSIRTYRAKRGRWMGFNTLRSWVRLKQPLLGS